MKKSLTGHIAFLERELKIADTDLGDMIRRSPAWRERDDLLQSVPGVAPRSRDSGTLGGRRFVQGGRATVRAVLCAL